MKDNFEKFVMENRIEFDSGIPNEGSWKKIELKFFSHGVTAILLKIAAVLIFGLGIGFYFFFSNNQNNNKIRLTQIAPKVAEAEIYYASIIERKKSELEQINFNEPDVSQNTLFKTEKLEEQYQNLKTELLKNINNEKVTAAMIKNLQMRIEILNMQLKQLQKINNKKNQLKNETKSV